MKSLEPKANPHIEAMQAYTPGEQPQGGGWVKLNTNENPYPPSPKAVEAVRDALANEGSLLRLYPSPDSTPLREAAAQLHDYTPAAIVAGNGSDDILNLLIRSYAGPGRPIGMLDPSYSLYPVLAAAQGAPVVRVPVKADHTFDVEAVAKCGAAIFFLTNPNAPLGVAFSVEQVIALAKAFPGLLVVDEAYAAFAGQNCAELAKQFSNVVVTRTLSKGHALAGLRAGYAICPLGVADILHRVRDSYNLDRLAQVAAAAALQDEDWLRATSAKIISTRQRMVEALRGLGWKVNESSANFVLAEPVAKGGVASVAAAESAFNFLRAQKILVRRFPHHPLTEKALRITVGTDAEIEVMLGAAAVWTKG